MLKFIYLNKKYFFICSLLKSLKYTIKGSICSEKKSAGIAQG